MENTPILDEMMNDLQRPKNTGSQLFWVSLFSFLFGFPLAIWAGFVTILYWGWFVEPSFHVAAPSLIAMTGIIVGVRFAVTNTGISKIPDNADLGDRLTHEISTGIVIPLFALVIGFVLQFFV